MYLLKPQIAKRRQMVCKSAPRSCHVYQMSAVKM